MLRGLVEALGWFIVICALAKLAGLIEFALYLSTPMSCPQEHRMQPKPAEHALIAQLKRDARRLVKTQPVTHSQALETLAKQHGHKTYAALRAAVRQEKQA